MPLTRDANAERLQPLTPWRHLVGGIAHGIGGVIRSNMRLVGKGADRAKTIPEKERLYPYLAYVLADDTENKRAVEDISIPWPLWGRGPLPRCSPVISSAYFDAALQKCAWHLSGITLSFHLAPD
jgi:hypothetical protein